MGWYRWGLLVLLAACVPSVPVTKSMDRPGELNAPGREVPLRALPPGRSNAQIAQDFMDLEFQLESGQSLPVLTRFEGPITLSMTGAVPASARGDLAALVGRLQSEAGLPLQLLPDDAEARLTLVFAPIALLRQMDAGAACFVIPNVSSLAEYQAKRGSAALDWDLMTERGRAALFLPSDSSPQEVRDCLHEETAQALGPLNDLYRLPDSVFNDDNFQSVLSPFDMLILRLHYAPELASGMEPAQVAALLPGLLARLNPGGAGGAGWSNPATPQAWRDLVQVAMQAGTSPAGRRAAAERLLGQAQAAGWQDARLGFAWFLRGRILAEDDPDAAEAAFTAAARIYATLPDGGIHLAHALMQLSAVALAKGQAARAISLAQGALPLAKAGQNAALRASLMQIEAEALALQGQEDQAAALRLDSLPLARYGFGSETQQRARLAEIAALARRGLQNAHKG